MAQYLTRNRILQITRSRGFTDPLAWFILYLLIIGYTTIVLWHHYTFEQHEFGSFINYLIKNNGSDNFWKALAVILSTSFVFLIILMITVYLNLTLLKKHTLERKKKSKTWRYGFYILLLLIICSFFTWFWNNLNDIIGGKETIWIRLDLKWYVSFFAQFAFSMAAMGLVYIREFNVKEKEITLVENSQRKVSKELEATVEKFHQVQYQLNESKHRLEELKDIEEQLEKTEEQLESVTNELELFKSQKQNSSFSISNNHIKIGTKKKYQIVLLSEILYIQGNNNDCIIHLKNRDNITSKNSTLKDYEQRLPEEQFLKVHRKYIINVEAVGRRENGYFKLKYDDGGEKSISIGSTHEKDIENHPYLGFL